MRKTSFVVGAALAALALSAGAQSGARKPYIVQLVDAPAAAYDGGVSGYAATRPAAGSRLNVNASNVQAYSSYLDRKQSNVIAQVPGAPVTYRYKNLLNGFGAFLTDAEVRKLAADPAVKSITEDVPMPLNTATTPTFLGINQPGGAWSRSDAAGRTIKGEGIIIGHLDSGVWPENPSFSDKVDPITGKPIASHLPGTRVYDPLPAGRWNGICQPSTGSSGQSFKPSMCNNKLVGARYYNSTWKLAESLGIVRTWSGEYLDSPRDPDGHGTHTLSTSGGNENVDVTVSGASFTISGIAPRARVAAYKVCYVGANAADVPQLGSCFQGDSAAAVEQAVADGVDVINFSVGGSGTSVQGVVDTAFANATFAGVFVSTSAGNGNTNGAPTVAHINPWVMTVANSSHDRFTVATVTLGTGQSFTGPSFQTGGLASKPLILAADAGGAPFASLSVADQLALARCFNASDRSDPALNPAGLPSPLAALDPAKVAGKIVVCYRGGNVLVNKMNQLDELGAAGGIILNIPAGVLPAPAAGASASSTLLIPFDVPAVHLAASAYAAISAHVAGGAGTASFSPSAQVAGVAAPVMAGTSSRGPNRRDANLLKPEITAPGTDIIAAYTNTSITPAQRLQIIDGTLIPGPGANMIGGTSMAAPHVAGTAALLKQANPGWSPYAIKSAIMTSAQQTVKLASGAPDPNRFGYGAGHLNPNGALDTQVVYDQSVFDHIDYYFGVIDGRSLNMASLTHANVVGVGSLTRTLFNKGSTPVTYTATASAAGYTVTVDPATLTIPAGGSAQYTVTMRRTTAPIEQYVFGDLRWSASGAPTLYSPLTLKASEIVALASVTDTRTTATKIYTVGFGYDGTLATIGTGLQPAATFANRIATGERQCVPVAVAAGAKTLRAQLFNVDTEGGASTDLDLVVLRSTGATVGSSGGADSNELVSLANPAADTYQVCVDGFATAAGGANYVLSAWVLGPTNPGTLRAFGPRNVVTGGVGSIGLSWNVPANARYLGLVEYRRTATSPVMARTEVFIDGADSGLAATAPTSAAVLLDKTSRAR